MNLFQKIRLSWRYGRAEYLISAVLTVASAALVLSDPLALSSCILLKVFSIPVILYLFASLQRKHTIYFYLNLGISRTEYFAIPVAVEFAAFVLLMVISLSLAYVIG